MIPAVQQVRSRPAEVDPDTLHELHAAIEGIDTDHPNYVELHDQWVFEFYGDLAIEIAEGQR